MMKINNMPKGLAPVFAGFMFCVLICLTAPLQAADWPQWRGDDRQGIWKETGIVEQLPTPQIPVVWRAKISGGYSGPTVKAGKVYITDRLEEPNEIERVHCFDAKTGKPIWTYAYDCPYGGVQYNTGPRTSVSLDLNKAYSLGTMGHLYCFDADR